MIDVEVDVTLLNQICSCQQCLFGFHKTFDIDDPHTSNITLNWCFVTKVAISNYSFDVAESDQVISTSQRLQ